MVAIALGSPAALARAEPPIDPDADDQGDFWGSVLAPGGVEIAMLVEAGRHQVTLARQAAEGRGDARFRAQRLREATAVAGRIRALDPRAPSLDFLLGLIADEAGRTGAAERHLAAFAARIEPGTMRTEALLRIGRIALVRRDPAAATGPLRAALAEQRTRADRAQALVLLAQALDDGGDLDGAIALLAGAIDRSQGPGETDDNGVWLALVAAYDRDEQVSASLELIERLKGALGADYVSRLAAGLDAHPPVPLAATWYQRALVYETGELLVPARAAWTTYLGLAPGTRYQARAQAHVDAIDLALAARRAPAAARRRPGARP